jgi:hypothetical protein
MAELDQTARFALKVVPAEAIAWLLPRLDPDLGFRGWLDTETIAFPGEPGRRCDTVAELVSRSGKSPPWALILEVEARPRATIRDRLLEYAGRVLRKLRHGPHRRDRYLVAAVLILLTGKRATLELHMDLPGTDLGLHWKPGLFCLADEQASATLERVARGELGRSVLPWVPLMAGGGEAAVVQEWVRLAREEPNSQRRSEYAGLALIFAERADCLRVWKKALEGWEMWESQVIREWKTEGRQEGLAEGRAEGLAEGLAKGRAEEKRNALLKVLQLRFQTELPADLAQVIQQTAELEVLSGWFDAALLAPSLEAFASAVRPVPPSPPGNP